MEPKKSKRDSLLEAAGQIAIGCGIEKLTLDAVAARAGVSKGGLIHHFPSKDALIEALMRAVIEIFRVEVEALIAQEEREEQISRSGRALRAYVRVATTAEAEFDALLIILAGASMQNERLRGVGREFFELWQSRLENDGIDRETAMLVRLAADGCWLSESFFPETGSGAGGRLQIVREALLKRISQAVETEEKR